MWALDGPTFFRLAYRMAAYQGVMRVRLEAEQARGGHPAATGGPGAADDRPAPLTDTELRHSAEFAGIVQWGRG